METTASEVQQQVRRHTSQSSPPRSAAPQIVIEPLPEGFAVRVGGEAVQLCGDELDAHHWGKHAFEAVNQGLRRPAEIGRAMHRLCLTASRYNLHR